jgi:ribosomal protein L12E/L44/L45/RPP1/RPP2
LAVVPRFDAACFALAVDRDVDEEVDDKDDDDDDDNEEEEEEEEEEEDEEEDASTWKESRTVRRMMSSP